MTSLKPDWKIALIAFFAFHLFPMFLTPFIPVLHTDLSLLLRGAIVGSVGATVDPTALILSQPWWEFVAPIGVGLIGGRFARFGALATAILVEVIAFALRAPILPSSPGWLLPTWGVFAAIAVIAGWYVGARLLRSSK